VTHDRVHSSVARVGVRASNKDGHVNAFGGRKLTRWTHQQLVVSAGNWLGDRDSNPQGRPLPQTASGTGRARLVPEAR